MGLVGASAAPALADVTFYVHADYGGGAMTVGEGRYDIDRISVGNDQISSVRVPPGWRVVLYEHAHFQGRTLTLDADARSLPGFNDLTSSIVVSRIGPPTVRDRRGRKCADEGGWCDFRGPATIYYGARDRWVMKEQAGRVRCANDVFGDPLVGVGKACFVDNERPEGVTFYIDANYGGGSMTLDEGRYDIDRLSIGNDKLSSVRVPPGWRVVLFEHAHFQGRTVVLEGDAPFLGDFNDLTSSIAISRPARGGYR
ncbi:MAG: hypothetical protein KIT31_22530 [Deltaproteobacteria bacterium]|nr:hypothetical protein [Deltaproteobacteria bacterium]